jgi:hypothetical protein
MLQFTLEAKCLTGATLLAVKHLSQPIFVLKRSATNLRPVKIGLGVWLDAIESQTRLLSR